MLLYIVPKQKFCRPQYTNIKGSDIPKQSLSGCPTEFPTPAARSQSDPDFIGFPSSSRILLNPISFLIVVQAHPDRFELNPN